MGQLESHLAENADSLDAFKGALNKTIAGLTLGDDDALHFLFEDGSSLKLFDSSNDCSQARYMRTDDSLGDFVGAQLLGADIKEAPSITNSFCEHEVQFLEVRTSKGCFTMASHNEHNGDYEGFCIEASKDDLDKSAEHESGCGLWPSPGEKR